MKILVPTDFTETSEHALDVAIKIAKKLQGEIHLYHSLDLPDDWEDLPAKVRYFDKENKATALALKEKFEALKEAIEQQGVGCKYHFTGGAYVDNISEVTEEVAFDLMVLGSKGLKGMNTWFDASNAQQVIRKLPVDALIIKKAIDTIDFKKVLYVTGLNKEDQEPFQHFLQFINHFDVAQLHIMAVNTAGFFTQPTIVMKEALKDFAALAEGMNVSTHFYPDFSVEAGVRHFCDEHDIELVAISNHVKHPIKRFFQGSNVEKVVNHVDVPIFSIDYQKD